MLKTRLGEVDPQEKLVEPTTPVRLTMNSLYTQKTTNQTDSMQKGDNSNNKKTEDEITVSHRKFKN